VLRPLRVRNWASAALVRPTTYAKAVELLRVPSGDVARLKIMGSSSVSLLSESLLRKNLRHNCTFSRCLPNTMNTAKGRVPVNRYGKIDVGWKVKKMDMAKVTNEYAVNAVTLIDKLYDD